MSSRRAAAPVLDADTEVAHDESEEGLETVGLDPVEPETPPHRRRAPAAAAEALMDGDGEGEGEEVLQTADLTPGAAIPLFTGPSGRGIRVVYVGGRPHHAPTLRGRVLQIVLGDEVSERADKYNLTSYEFRAHDALGRKNPKRMSDRHPIVQARGRPYAWVKHGAHLYHFARHRPGCSCNDKQCGGGYLLMRTDPATDFAVQEWVARCDRARKQSRATLNEIAPERAS